MSDESKHTPGPWEWRWRKDDDINPGSVVSVGFPHAPERPFAIAMCPRYRGPNHEQRWDADARLIAAAPDMVREMERYLPILERAEQEPRLWEKLAEGTGIATANGFRAAIAKAREAG